MRKLQVELGARSYAIHIGAGLLDDGALLRELTGRHRVALISDDTVAGLYADRVSAALGRDDLLDLRIPAGEAHKTLDTASTLIDALLEARWDRHGVVLALGGGVVGDIAGFVSACVLRGVSFVQIPTTLLAQVDSSVGGKTGVNHARGKNLIGAFHQPRAVLADTRTLSTLPRRELVAGLAEVIKYGLIMDRPLLDWLERTMPALLAGDDDALALAIEQSCRDKALIVAEDERESGRRALLNLGHTFGHAIEAGLGYGTWLHGEAVGLGLLLAADLSLALGQLQPHEVTRIEQLLESTGLPTRLPAPLGSTRMLDLMASDKKVADGRLRLVVLQGLGAAELRDDVPPELLREVLDHRREREPAPA